MPSSLNLRALFRPESVAVVGASSTPGKIGHTVVANLKAAGFPGVVHAVNPKGGEVEGLRMLEHVGQIPGPLDLAVVCIPRRGVAEALEELGRLPTRAAIVISAGFKEVGKSGYHMEEELVAIAARNGMALLGPNCLGLIDTGSRLNASFAAGHPKEGSIAFFSQSGALCVAILDWALGENIGFSSFISLGNKAALDESHMLDWLAQDERTNVILGYIENVADGRAFLEKAKAVTRTKPVILIKSGTTAAGARAASSHTGAIAGSDQAYAAAFRQSGVIRVSSVEALFNLAEAFSTQPLPAGPNLTVVTNSGGPGILAADATEKSRLLMTTLAPSTIEKLTAALPTYAALYNPVDIVGDADAERYRAALAAVIEDPNTHAVLALLTPTASADVEGTARVIAQTAARARELGKPVFACFMGQLRVAPGREILQDAGIPCYAFPEPAIAAMESMYAYAEWRARPEPVEVCVQRDLDAARKVLEDARKWGVREIVEFQAQELLSAYDLPVPRSQLARSSTQAVAAAEKIGYPVVMKIASAQISHKTDVQGVKVNLAGAEEVREAFLEITSRAQRLRPEAFLSGVLVQAMARRGSKECIIGFKRDDQFGPLVMFGLGGIYVEVLKDIAFRLAPLSKTDAAEIVREIKSYLLLKGFRGEAAVNFEALEQIILTMSQLAVDFPEVYEAEFNPVLVNPKEALVADVRLTLAY